VEGILLLLGVFVLAAVFPPFTENSMVSSREEEGVACAALALASPQAAAFEACFTRQATATHTSMARRAAEGTSTAIRRVLPWESPGSESPLESGGGREGEGDTLLSVAVMVVTGVPPEMAVRKEEKEATRKAASTARSVVLPVDARAAMRSTLEAVIAFPRAPEAVFEVRADPRAAARDAWEAMAAAPRPTESVADVSGGTAREKSTRMPEVAAAPRGRAEAAASRRRERVSGEGPKSGEPVSEVASLQLV